MPASSQRTSRKVCIAIDGKTRYLYSGEIGKHLAYCENVDVITLEPIAISELFETQLQVMADINSNRDNSVI